MVFATGDCHGNFERFKPKYFPEQARMTKQDIMICAGDFGGSPPCRRRAMVESRRPV